LTVAVHQNNRLAQHQAVALSELDGEPFVWFDRVQNPVFFDYVEQVCSRSGLRRRIVQDAANDPTQLTLVAAQVGITFSPVSAGRTKPENVRLIRIREDPLKLTLYGAWRQNENTCPALHQLLRIVRQRAIQ
jgi:DNA-binding transcriptional LysR family regulator